MVGVYSSNLKDSTKNEICSLYIKFLTMEQVYNFVDDVKNFKSEIGLVSTSNHRYCVDAKSILGVLALNISNVLDVRMMSNDINEIEEFVKKMEKYKYVESM